MQLYSIETGRVQATRLRQSQRPKPLPGAMRDCEKGRREVSESEGYIASARRIGNGNMSDIESSSESDSLLKGRRGGLDNGGNNQRRLLNQLSDDDDDSHHHHQSHRINISPIVDCCDGNSGLKRRSSGYRRRAGGRPRHLLGQLCSRLCCLFCLCRVMNDCLVSTFCFWRRRPLRPRTIKVGKQLWCSL